MARAGEIFQRTQRRQMRYHGRRESESWGLTMHAVFVKGATIAAFAVLLTTTVAAAQPARLPPSEIQTTFFNGQPFTASTLSNVKYKMTFMADGKMKREPIGSGNKGEGSWKLSKDGFCTTWGGCHHGQLLHPGECRRQQMVGDEGLDHSGDLDQVKDALQICAERSRIVGARP